MAALGQVLLIYGGGFLLAGIAAEQYAPGTAISGVLGAASFMVIPVILKLLEDQ